MLTSIYYTHSTAGYYWNSTATITRPSWVVPGTTYLIGVVADYQGGINESKESNNASAGVAITVPVVQPTVSIADASVTEEGTLAFRVSLSALRASQRKGR